MLLDLQAAGDEVPDVHAPADSSKHSSLFTPDSGQAWVRLGLALIIGSIGSVGMWSVVVVLPGVQAEFGATRGAVSLAFTLTMLGFGLGGVATGKITDRFGIVAAISLSIAILGSGYLMAGLSTTLWQFIAVHFLIGLGTSATFGPLMAEASHWFERYRGLAVTIVASGNYVGGTIWPPLVNWGVQSAGWRTTHIAIGIFCAVAMTIMLLLLRAQIGRATQRSHANARRSAALDQYRDGDAVHRQHFLLRGDGDAPGPHRRLLRRSRLRRGARRRDAVADDGVRSDQPHRFGVSRRQDRRHPDPADRIGGAGLCAVVLSVFRQPQFALRHLRDVRAVSGRHRAELRHH